MAKKASQEPVQTLIETFNDFNEMKHIDKTTLLGVLEESFRSVIAKLFGSDENYTVIVNPDKGDLEITRSREVVADEDLIDSNSQIPLSEARKIEEDFESGEEVKDLAFRPTRIIAVGDSGFVRNWSLANDGNANRDFFLNCVKYLSGRDALTQSGAETDLLVSQMDRSDRARFVVVSAIALPFFVFVVMALAIRRRRSR